ncbi:hypothetical protein [Serratia marcescens]|uniref:hypothetical protein n=1 Tax=Serratia marcescens TaxID=615 RepID=UPI0011C41E12|nr:hypothetical protein [Serratia marcescens]
MNQAILILKGQKPSIINITSGITSLFWMLPDGSETELEVYMARAETINGDFVDCIVATNDSELSPRDISRALEETSK